MVVMYAHDDLHKKTLFQDSIHDYVVHKTCHVSSLSSVFTIGFRLCIFSSKCLISQFVG